MSTRTTGQEAGPFTLNGGYIEEMTANSKGGTELMTERIFERLPASLLQQFNIIPSRVRIVDPDRPNILWLHDVHTDLEARHLANEQSRSRFSRLVFVSHWQSFCYQAFLGVPPSKCITLKNAIVPFEERERDPNTCRIIYNTTPHRGLEILVPVFERIAKYFGPLVELDVYSSFTQYGDSWAARNEPYERLFNFCRQHPQINYYGARPYDEVREGLLNAHIMAYPSIYPETSCLAVIDAMSAGCDVVCSDLAALPETTGGLCAMYPWHENQAKHVEIFEANLVSAIKGWFNDPNCARRMAAKAYADRVYSIDTRALEWQKLLYQVLGEHTDVID